MGKELGNKLIPKVISLINEDKGLPIVVTTKPDGKPHFSLVALIRVLDAETIRFGLYQKSQTLENVKRDGLVCMSISGEGNIAIALEGKGKHLRDFAHFSVIEFKIEKIESKRSPYSKVVKGIEIDTDVEKVKPFFEELIKQI